MDVMLDLETLGCKPGCVILSIGAVAFTRDGAIDGERGSFYRVLSVHGGLRRGHHVDASTLAWWVRQDPAAKPSLLEALDKADDGLSALIDFAEWLRGWGDDVVVWGNGASFDQPILASYYAVGDLPLPWAFWNERCYRTLKNQVPDVKMSRSGVHHNALDDARSQAIHAVDLLRALRR